jgi:hypothetical protein
MQKVLILVNFNLQYMQGIFALFYKIFSLLLYTDLD